MGCFDLIRKGVLDRLDDQYDLFNSIVDMDIRHYAGLILSELDVENIRFHNEDGVKSGVLVAFFPEVTYFLTKYPLSEPKGKYFLREVKSFLEFQFNISKNWFLDIDIADDSFLLNFSRK